MMLLYVPEQVRKLGEIMSKLVERADILHLQPIARCDIQITGQRTPGVNEFLPSAGSTRPDIHADEEAARTREMTLGEFDEIENGVVIHVKQDRTALVKSNCCASSGFPKRLASISVGAFGSSPALANLRSPAAIVS